MTRMIAKTLADRDIDRINGACEEKNINAALDHIVKILHDKTLLVTLMRLRRELTEGAVGRHAHKVYKFDNVFQRLLERLGITSSQWDKIESISQKWSQIYDTPDTDYQVKALVSDLNIFFSGKTVSYPKKITAALWDFSLEFPDIHLKYFDEVIHLFVVCDSRAGSNEFSLIEKSIHENDTSLKINLVLVVGNGDTLRALAEESDIEVVVIDDPDVIEILLSPNSRQAFCHTIAKRVSVPVLQPYQTKSKVRDRMFYGRQDEIKRIKSNLSSCFAIFGGRLVGKSSLLHKIKCEFEKDENFKVCSITKEGFTSLVEVSRDILKQLSIPTQTHRNLLTFERLIRDYLDSHTNLKILVLIDEIDDIIIADEEKKGTLFQKLHNLNSDYGERCRFIFAGYRELARRCMDNTTRFWNFPETIRLGSLSPMQARKLIEDPLCDELGFSFQDRVLVDKILEITGGHPNYIQVFCKELSEYLEKQSRRKIRQEDIDAIFENQEFRGQITQTFRINFSIFQQLITSLVIIEDLTEFDEAKVVKLLHDYGLENIDLNQIFVEFRQLELAFVIEQSGRSFHFTHKLFPKMLEKTINLFEVVEVITDQLNRVQK